MAKKKSKKKILIGVAAAIGLILVVAAFQPNTFHVERSIVVNASPEAVFEQVNDFHKMNAWNPFMKMDPNAKQTFSGPSSGVGQTLAWAGNEKVGEGRETVVQSRPNEYVRAKLEFFKPFPGKSTAEFIIKPVGKEGKNGKQTKVTWTFFGPSNYGQKLMCLFMSMDKMMGRHFEAGLADMKKVVEKK